MEKQIIVDTITEAQKSAKKSKDYKEISQEFDEMESFDIHQDK